jgi:hypothetical protein
MQITYRVSEADYQRAWKLRVKGGFGQNKIVRTIMFWVFILVCLMMLWAVVTKTSERRAESSPEVVEQSSDESSAPQQSGRPLAHELLVNVGPFVLIMGIWIFMLFQMRPRAMRRQYIKDPTMQGTYTVDLTPTELVLENTAGVSTRMAWDLCDYWREGNGVFVLVNKSGTYFIISTADLSEPQRDELRRTLSSALQKK